MGNTIYNQPPAESGSEELKNLLTNVVHHVQYTVHIIKHRLTHNAVFVWNVM